jgi:UDP-N-acetylglucosamine diphosphorylase/glucosamine-1-phosphate N-acetyltransferase
MMNLILFDDSRRDHLLPLSFTRPQSEFRIGILTIREKWEKHLGCKGSCKTQEYLNAKFPLKRTENNLLISGSLIPTVELLDAINGLKEGEALTIDKEVVAAINNDGSLSTSVDDYKCIEFASETLRINNLWDIFSLNAKAIDLDFDLLTKGRKSADIDKSNTIIGDRFFAEEGAKAWCSVFNTTSGPIYLGKNSEVWEGTVIRGAFALCEESSVKLGAKVYGATTVGPHSRIGGEVNNSVIFGYSNKGHDGFLGNSVLGEWCNIGADSNNSNLKNNYSEVKLWNYPKQGFASTGLQFCGLIMGDHSKCGINTMFNTGTVVGVSANIFGAGFPRNFIPSFSWGGPQGITDYKLEKASETAALVMERRHIKFDEQEQMLLSNVYDLTKKYRQGG